MTFLDGTKKLGTATLSMAGGVTTAKYTTSSLAVGNHAISASYAGDKTFNTGVSASSNETVGKAATVMTLVASVNPPALGQKVTFTATLSASPPGSGSPPAR